MHDFMPFCERHGLEPGLVAGSMLIFQQNPAYPVHMTNDFEPTGLMVGATPSKRIGVIDEATGAVLFEWDGDVRALRAVYDGC
jgi:hypothetical protein